ncbi:Uncharacterized protein OBRU01_04632 [Operophtera brumata]|uniref:DDE Tnp4 domain-containing protein n=1 Tax=Operophtera brumata TaxID=104452 RepID=A0A0L7LNN3_OPEBR|nr:Uncharacterized protein OBRU01_04632 [Operophtera brumata]
MALIPRSTEEWKSIEEGFSQKWNFPGCCGALDGKHVVLNAPDDSGSYYYNYKNQHSIVLMALVDHDYCFIYFDIGCNGRISTIQSVTVDTENIETGNITPGSWREFLPAGIVNIERSLQNRSSQQAHNVRDRYADYFVGEGSVPWQARMVH